MTNINKYKLITSKNNTWHQKLMQQNKQMKIGKADNMWMKSFCALTKQKSNSHDGTNYLQIMYLTKDLYLEHKEFLQLSGKK